MENFRTFDSGATRDAADGKLEYGNYIHPLNDYSFANYMKWKQIIGGEYRRGDNWQKGIPDESLFDSLIRHIEILKLLRKGHKVIEIKVKGKIDLIIDWEAPENAEVFEKNIIDELNAIRFNSEALKLFYLTQNNV